MPPTTNAKIEDLRARVRLDPKSRHFYQLAEELRKIGQIEEAEPILRKGLEVHESYLSGWMSLGRVLRDLGKGKDAIEAFQRVLTLDPSNVPAARHLAECYLAQGEKVEAIKKFKLVRALLPADEAVEAQIDLLERELNPQKFVQETAAEGTPAVMTESFSGAKPTSLFGEEPAAVDPETVVTQGVDELSNEPLVVSDPFSSLAPAPTIVDGAVMNGFDIDGTPGFSVVTLEEELAPSQGSLSDPGSFGVDQQSENSAAPSPEAQQPEDPSPIETETMAELYARQGHLQQARDIYARILQRDPQNEEVRSRLRGLSSGSTEGLPASNRKVERLQKWLTRVGPKRGGGDV